MNICELLASASRTSSGDCLTARAQSLFIGGVLNDLHPLEISVTTANDLLDLGIETDVRCSEADNLPGLKFELWEGKASPGRVNTCNEIFTGIFQAFHFQTLLELDLSGLDVSGSVPKFRDTLAATYGTLPMLCNIVVGWVTASSLVGILSLGSDGQGDWGPADESDVSSWDGSDDSEDSDQELDMSPIRSSSPLAFPALRKLKLSGVPFDEDTYDPIFVVEVDHLEKCLINRSRRGVGILVLVLDNCQDLFDEDVGRLKELVPDVEWYETEGDEESEED